MQLLKDIKIGRLVLAIVATLVIADTVPHPGLSAGLIENSMQWIQVGNTEEAVETKIAEKAQ